MGDYLLAVAGTGTLRLVDASPSDVRKVSALVDLRAADPTAGTEPLLTVRFVDRLDSGTLRLVGPRHATDGERLLMRAGSGWARLPLGDGGEELVCERAADEVPHLVDLLNLAALDRGTLPLHAAALVREGEGVLLLGWSQGGKTEAVLACTARGDQLVGDEWVHLNPTGVARSIGYRMRVWAWQLEQSPHVWRQVPARERVRVRLVGAALRAAPTRLHAPLRRRHGVYLQPRQVFGDQLAAAAVIRRVVLLESHTSQDCLGLDADAHEIAERACVSNRFERRGLMESYAAWRFAVPGLRDARLDTVDQRELELARELLGSLPGRVVRHPHPVRLDRLAALV